MKNSHETGWALLLLGAALLLVQMLPARYWPDNARLLAIFSLPVKRLCPNYVLHGAPQRLMQTCFDIYAFSVTLQHPA
ncbi:hypothetical protein K3H27_20505, partial [Aeromonas veronii]|nr:hypothetical protein [Aeromonas veronii]